MVKTPAVICDLDGTLSSVEHRREHVERGDWKTFFELMNYDAPVPNVIRLMDSAPSDWSRIIVTARPDNYYWNVIVWLNEHRIDYDDLYMRKKGDTRQDAIVKEEILQRILKKYDPQWAIDDRDSVIEVWQKYGIETTKVYDPGLPPIEGRKKKAISDKSYLVDLASSEAVGEGLRAILFAWIDRDPTEVLDYFDLNTVYQDDVDRAANYIVNQTRKNIPDSLVLYRSGDFNSLIVSMTESYSTARTFGEPREYEVPKHAVFCRVDQFIHGGTFVESEYFVESSNLGSYAIGKRPGGEQRGNAEDRRRRKEWLLSYFGDGFYVSCTYCPRVLDFESVEADRVDIGGSYRRDNIVPACRRCNSQRGNREDWEIDWDDPELRKEMVARFRDR